MIHAIRLRRFRGFESIELPLKRLTLLVGPNSSGKSSFGHALAAMSHAQRFGKDTLSALDDPEIWPVELGDTKDLRTTATTGDIRIDLKTDYGWVEHGFGGATGRSDLAISYLSYPLFGPATTTTVSISAVLEEISSSSSETGAKPQSIEKVTSPFITLRREEGNRWLDVQKREEAVVALEGVVLQTLFRLTGTQIPFVSQARDEVRAFLRSTQYLRASRKRPMRSYKRERDKDGMLDYSGRFFPSVLHEYGDKPIAFLAPTSLPQTVEEAMGLINAHWIHRTEPLETAVGWWLNHLGLAKEFRVAERNSYDFQALAVLASGSEHDVTEIGFGISQVVPVLIAGLRQDPMGILIVDLPEAHLHPRPQAWLADFFCALLLSGRQCLVETHSDMLFNQLRLRGALNDEVLANTQVYFLDPPGTDGYCKPPRAVGIGLEDVPSWPPGFQNEALEIEQQIEDVREARNSRIK